MNVSDNRIAISGKRLRQLREKYKISQKDLACEIDVEQKTITCLESDKYSTSLLCVAYKLAKFFNVTIENLID